MALVKWDPARELDVLQSSMNQLFDTFFQGNGVAGSGNGRNVRRWIPAMDLAETDGEFVLRADLPGLTEDDVTIEVKDNVLTISGERDSGYERSGTGFYRAERAHGRFLRSLDLPAGVDTASVTAAFENGVLEVRIPKPEEHQPIRIPIGGTREIAQNSS